MMEFELGTSTLFRAFLRSMLRDVRVFFARPRREPTRTEFWRYASECA